jgi:hypothetical protein
MLQIGQILRQARVAQELELEAIAAVTRIRVRYLAALEAERFDELPGDAYARSFLRQYASLVGLDPAPLLEELETRLGEHEPPRFVVVPPRRRTHHGAAALVVILAALAVLLWLAGGDRPPRTLNVTPSPLPGAASTLPAARSVPVHPKPKPAPPASAFRLVLVARGGRCWLLVREGSAGGRVLYERTLEQAGVVGLTGRRFWIRAGAPWNLELRLGGRTLSLPPSSRPLNILVTRAGLQTS